MSFPLEARGLTRQKADGGWLLRGASLRVAPGERIGIGGPSGAGKTVFLRSLALLDPLLAGGVWWSGEEVTGDAVPRYRSQVSYVHQRPAFVEGSVEHNLSFPFQLGVYRGRMFDRARAIAWLERLGKPESFLTKAHDELSGGEAQVTALVRALIVEPSVLLLDEPTAALDARSAELVEALLGAWVDEAKDRRALACVSHDEDLLDRLTPRRLQLSDATLTERP